MSNGFIYFDESHPPQEQVPTLKLIALSMHEESEYIGGFIEAGGSGYVSKSAIEHELVDAVRAVVRGERYVSSKLLYKFVQSMTHTPKTAEVPLTERERDILAGLAKGRRYREIAETLGISEKMVATYRERATDKLSLRSRAELVRYAIEHGLLE